MTNQKMRGSVLLISILAATLIGALLTVFIFLKPNGTGGSSNASYQTAIDYTKDTQIQADFKAIQTALEQYRLKHEKYPTDLEELKAELLLNKIPTNPYDNSRYSFQSDSKNYTLSTKMGGGKDFTITN